jgi:hypothetical protein
MTVQVRSKRAATRTSRVRREGRVEHPVSRSDSRVEDAGGLRLRLGGPTQDRALYTCQCGFVFEASVSTSVGCPHCGDTQAW